MKHLLAWLRALDERLVLNYHEMDDLDPNARWGEQPWLNTL